MRSTNSTDCVPAVQFSAPWHARLTRARATDAAMLSRPGGQLALVVTPTLTMVALAPLCETDLLLVRPSMAWGRGAHTAPSAGSRPAQAENGPGLEVAIGGRLCMHTGLLKARKVAEVLQVRKTQNLSVMSGPVTTLQGLAINRE